METTTQAPGALLQAFLAAHEAEDGAARLLAAFVADAHVVIDRDVKRLAEVSPTALDAYIRKERADWERGVPGSKALAPCELGDEVGWREEGGTKAVGCWAARCGTQREPGFLLAGFQREGEAWRIAWLTLEPEARQWSWDLGKAQMLGLWGLVRMAPLARSWADLAAFRHWDYGRPAMYTLPEANFACQGSGMCCKHEWSIEVYPESQAMLDAIPWAEIEPRYHGVQLAPAQKDGMLELKARFQPCQFLDENLQCGIHKALGWQPFRICAIFPYNFARTPEGLAVTASGLCGAARNNMGPPVASNRADAHYRRSLFYALETDAYRLTRDVTIPWEEFKAIEDELLELITDPKRPLPRRLWIASCLLEALAEGKREWDPAWETEPFFVQGPEDAGDTDHLLGLRLPWNSAALQPLKGLPRPRPRHGKVPREAELVSILRNAIFGKHFSYQLDLTTAQNMLTWLYVIWMVLAEMHPDQEMPTGMVEIVAQLAFHSKLLHGLADAPGAEPTQLGQVVARAVHARWLLGYPLPADS